LLPPLLFRWLYSRIRRRKQAHDYPVVSACPNLLWFRSVQFDSRFFACCIVAQEVGLRALPRPRSVRNPASRGSPFRPANGKLQRTYAASQRRHAKYTTHSGMLKQPDNHELACAFECVRIASEKAKAAARRLSQNSKLRSEGSEVNRPDRKVGICG